MNYPTAAVAALAALCAATSLADDDGARCRQQSEQVLARLQAEVVGPLDAAQVATANGIVLDVCEARERQVAAQVEAEVEAQVEAQVGAAVEQARKEEQAKSGWWSTESADKPGNKRLKRKGT